jgi:transposase
MDPEKMAELERLIATLGNVSEACKAAGISRSFYYVWKKQQAEKAGAERDARPRRHPQATLDPIRNMILELASQFPDWGCDRISFYLGLRKMPVSPTTVQKLLRKHGLGSRKARNVLRPNP